MVFKLFKLALFNPQRKKRKTTGVPTKCYRKDCTPTSFLFPEDYQHLANIKVRSRTLAYTIKKKGAWEGKTSTCVLFTYHQTANINHCMYIRELDCLAGIEKKKKRKSH